MQLSSKSEYAILSLLELALRYESGESLQIRQIAALQNIPDRYLEQLLATLRRGGLIKSIRGVNGGYVLARAPHKITLLDAVNCMEGSEAVKNSKLKTVESNVIHSIWQEACVEANSVLQQCTLADLCKRRELRHQMGLMYYI